MSATGIDAFDTTLHKTSIWIDEIMQAMAWEDKHRAYSSLRAVLHALRDRLVVDEAIDLGAQLPMLIRGFYFEGYRTAGKPLKYRHKEEFLQRLRVDLPAMANEELEQVAMAVFDVLNRHISAGEVDEVRNQLPEELRGLWHRAA